MLLEAEEYKKLLDLESLRDIIKELQDTKLKLIVQIDELKEQIKTQRADHTDVYFYLNKKCDDAFETIESLGNNNNINNMIIIIIIIILSLLLLLEIQILKEHDERSKHESELNQYINDLKHKASLEGNHHYHHYTNIIIIIILTLFLIIIII